MADRGRLIETLKEKARQIRENVVRIAGVSECHTGGALSIAEVMAALYFHVMKVDPRNPEWTERDYLVLSKGHSAPALYAALAMRGFFPEEALLTHLEPGSILPGHACARMTPGVDVSTGSLGHGLSIGAGLALGVRMDGAENRVFVVLGDGELQEGSNWEAAMAAAHHGLDHLVAIVDRNGYQSGPTEEIMALEPLVEKWTGFGWAARRIDGHDLVQVVDALEHVPLRTGRPSALIADTVKGKGISFLKHLHAARLDERQLRDALDELGAPPPG